ncbi:MAG: acyl-CoA dehydrogenase [Planctomycetota bacterium]
MKQLAKLSERARVFAAGVAPLVEAVDHEQGVARALEALAREGFLGWCVPASWAGTGTDGLVDDGEVSVRALCAIRARLAYESGLLDVAFVMQGLGSYPVACGGQDDLRGSLLPLVVEGKAVAAFALTEPGAGSSLGEIATTATRTDTGWSLRGHKTFISNAGIADFYSVLARTDGTPADKDLSGNFTMFHVPASTRGIEIRPFEVIAPHPIGEVLLNDVHVPDAHRLGEVGGGLALALRTLNRFRTSVAAAACGFARRALDESVDHLARRVQFGRPLSAFQGLRFDVAEMDTRLRASELLVDEAAAAVDAGAENTREVARAKLFSTETASWVCDRAVQHLGGLGVRRGEVVERLFREVRSLRIYEGTSEIQKLILAKSIFEDRAASTESKSKG